MSKDITFILFHGFGSSKMYWEYEFKGSAILRKLNFFSELKKIGNVYTFNMTHFNI